MQHKIIITFLLLSILCVPFLPSAAESAGTYPEKDNIRDGELISVMKSFSASFKKGNVEEYMSFFSLTALENGTNPVDKIRANYTDIISHNLITLYEFEISEIKKAGDSAVVDASYNKTLVSKAEGTALLTSGNVRMRFIKENNKIKIS